MEYCEYKIVWRSGRQQNTLQRGYDNIAKAKLAATKFLKSHYLDDVTVVRVDDNGFETPLEIRKCKRVNYTPYYGDWQYVEHALSD